VTRTFRAAPGASPARRRAALPALAFVSLVTLAAPAGGADLLPPPDRLLGWVRELSSPAMDGRASGTPGADRAARYLAEHFRRIGLRPIGDGGSYFQRFPVLTGVRLGAASALTQSVAGGVGGARVFALGSDFLPFAFSDDGDVSGEVVFAGYGITAPAVGYDDYAGLEVGGRIVLVMTGEPREQDPQGPFRPAEHFHYTELRHKVLNAREHGARGIIVVENPARPDPGLRPLRGTTPAWGIVAIGATRGVADGLLAPSGQDLASLATSIDRALAPASRTLASVTVTLRVSLVRERGETANVIGFLPGTDPGLRDEALVLGAHYDHLGRGSPVSLEPTHADAIHPGADDNASGTAVVVGLAEAFARAGGARRGLVFALFSAEEVGLLGSGHYVRQPPVPVERTVAMANFDMVGRMREDRLHVMGVDTGHGLRAVVEQAAAGQGLTLALRGDGVGPSDHSAFLGREIPVLFFFTGTHGDYHRPSDTWDRVNPDGMRKVAAVAYRAIRALADRDDRPAFARVPGPAVAARGSGRGYGPYFGIVPDFAESPAPGVRLGGVRPGSPAERAGLRTGDVILRFAGVTVRTLDDLTFALRQKRPGDVVEVTFTRDGAPRTAAATLEHRR
jgi:hypothetical protein